jgi:phage-related protein
VATFTWVPDYGAKLAMKPRVRTVQFGDGYMQRSADGINTNPRTGALSFSNRTDAEANAIIAFLDARGGVEAFDYTPPGGSAGKYICQEYDRAQVSYDVATVTASFKQVFEA